MGVDPAGDSHRRLAVGRVSSLLQQASRAGISHYLGTMRASDLLHPRPEGLYCPPGDFFIDPVRPVNRALITHGHSDHARSGHRSVLATQQTLDIMGLRYGEHFADTTQAAILGETIVLNGVSISFHPAGHVLGSA